MLAGHKRGVVLRLFIQEGSPPWEEGMRVPAPPGEMAAELVKTEYGAFCTPLDCTVLVLVPQGLVTGDNMLMGVLPGFQRCTDLNFRKANRGPNAHLTKHKLDVLFPPEQSNALWQTQSEREEKKKDSEACTSAARAGAGVPRRGRCPSVRRAQSRVMASGPPPQLLQTSMTLDQGLRSRRSWPRRWPTSLADQREQRRCPGPGQPVFKNKSKRNYRVVVSNISMGCYQNENTAAQIRGEWIRSLYTQDSYRMRFWIY